MESLCVVERRICVINRGQLKLGVLRAHTSSGLCHMEDGRQGDILASWERDYNILEQKRLSIP